MRLNKATGNMSLFLTHTWPFFEGCKHRCKYCWAERFAHRRGYNFEPRQIETQLKGTLRRTGLIIGVSWTGDMWGDWVRNVCLESVLDKIRTLPKNIFVPLTKNPARYLEYKHRIPQNVILGATIESNIHYPAITDAPAPVERYKAMRSLDLEKFKKFLIIEPIMKFDVEILVQWIGEINPVAVEIGADSGNNQLPEPSFKEIHELVKRIRYSGIKVLLKGNLKRLYDPQQDLRAYLDYVV